MRAVLTLVLAAILALGSPALLAAPDPVSVTLRTGGSFEGRITESDDDGFTLRRTAGGEFRLLWKDLDDASWLAARRSLTDQEDGPALLELAKFAAEHGLRLEAETLLAAVRRADGGLAADVAALEPGVAALRRAEAADLVARAKALLEDQDWFQALGRFRDAVELAPDDPVATNGVGECYYEMRRLRECREQVEKAIELDPTYKDALLNRAWLDLLELDFEGCLAGLDVLLKLPADEGRAGTREELMELATREKGLSQEEAWERWADQPLIQARDLRPVIGGIVAGPGFDPEYVTETMHYRVRTDVSQEYADKMGEHLELIYKEYERQYSPSRTGERKTRGKALRFPVLVFKDRNGYIQWFERVLKNPLMARGTGGVYVPLVKHLVFFQNQTWLDTRLVAWHEAFHQYLDYFVARAPHWFNEGQAEYFGASTLTKSGKRVDVGQSNPWRMGVLQALLKSGRLPRASELMQRDAQTFMTGKSSDPRYADTKPNTAVENYAASWALVHFCLEGDRKRYAKNLMNYFRELCDGTSHADAYEAAWSRVKWDKFDDAYRKHCHWLVERAVAEKKGTEIPPIPR